MAFLNSISSYAMRHVHPASSNVFLSTRFLLRELFAVSAVSCTEISNLPVLVAAKENLTAKSYQIPHVDACKSKTRLRELVKAGQLDAARHLFDRMPHKNEISCTIMMSGYVNSNMKRSEALIFFSAMLVDPTVRMDPYILSLALKACGLEEDGDFGESLHVYSVKIGLATSVIVGSALIDMYTKTTRISDGCASRVFDEMPAKNVVTWTAIITGLVRSGYNQDGLTYFTEMLRSNVGYDSHTYAIALKACVDSDALNFGRAIHTRVMKEGFYSNSFVVNNLATMYDKCGKLLYGVRLLEIMQMKDVVSWTTIITLYVKMHQEIHAIEKFIEMQKSEVSPNDYTFAAVVSSCINLSRSDWGEQLHSRILRMGFMDSLSVANSIMCMYAKCRKLTSMSIVFHQMNRRDIVSWNSIIAGYSQGGCVEEAFELFSSMRWDGETPDEFSISSMLSVCGYMAVLGQGKQLHVHALTIGLDGSSMIRSALISMYSKCGSIGEAFRIFDVGPNDDIVIWTAMVNGYAEHGCSHETINLFEMIPTVGLKPDHITFIGVLSACSHAGLVDLGFHYFNTMCKRYQIIPSQEHYGCLVDLLCRAGLLADAECLIRSMPCKHNHVVWSTLLRACAINGDFNRGITAAEQMFEVEPTSAWTHITLANMYSLKGWWREAGDIRKLMRSRGLVKEPGWSWIKIKNRVFKFVSGDWSHALGEDICHMLSLLTFRTEISDNALVMDSFHCDEDSLMI